MCLSFQLSRRDVQQFGVLPACTPHQFFASHLCGVPPLADLENRRRPFKCFSFARGHSVRWGQVGSGDVAEPLKEEGPSLPGRAGRLQPPTLRILTPASSSCARPSPSAPGGSGPGLCGRPRAAAALAPAACGRPHLLGGFMPGASREWL